MVLVCIRRKSEKAVRNKSVSINLLWFLLQFLPPHSFLELLPGISFIGGCDWNIHMEINPFLCMLLLALVFYHSNRNSKTSSLQLCSVRFEFQTDNEYTISINRSMKYMARTSIHCLFTTYLNSLWTDKPDFIWLSWPGRKNHLTILLSEEE